MIPLNPVCEKGETNMRRSQVEARLKELFGDDDVEVYFDSNGESAFTDNFQIYIDDDGDAVIKPN
jgi:NADPH:quinone reductase-like Zn-dependent oxidoreductase